MSFCKPIQLSDYRMTVPYEALELLPQPSQPPVLPPLPMKQLKQLQSLKAFSATSQDAPSQEGKNQITFGTTAFIYL